MKTISTKIDHLGALGDGVVLHQDNAVHVPFTLADEDVTIGLEGNTATLQNVDKASPKRVEPVCKHFGTCGGCALQHLETKAYQDWKRERVVDALAKRGIEAEVAPLITCDLGERRRSQFAARKTENGFLFGYHAKASKQIVPITECPILVQDIQARLPDIKAMAEMATPAKGELKLAVFSAENGLDLSISGIGKLSEDARQKLIRAALQKGFQRLSLEDEILIESERPIIEFAGTQVSIPPGGFSQATRKAQDSMINLVTTHLKGCKSVADLFCGSGTFALALARQSKVYAAEFDTPALKALDHAARYGKGLKPLKHERRDLFRRPVFARELKYTQGLVFDPPRAGAEVQCQEIAKSAVKKVVAVSCNPVTFARDARILIDGGFTLKTVTPIDQFLYSSHVEVVATFSRR